MGSTMKKEDVVIGGAAFSPGKFAALRSSISKACAQRGVAADVPGGKLSEAAALLQPFPASGKDATYAEVYWKVGFIGNDLVFRVKSKKKGVAGITGHTEEDVVLLKKARPDKAAAKAAAAPPAKAKDEELKIPTYVMWDSSRAPKLLKDQAFVAQLSGGRVQAQVTVTVPDIATPRSKAECRKIAADVLKGVADEVEAEIAGLERAMIATRGDPAKLTKLAADAAREVERISAPATIETAIESKCTALLKGDEQLRKLDTEWKVKAGFKIVGKSLSAALATTRLVFSAGADVTAYISLGAAAVGMGLVVKDILAKEPALRDSLVKAIQDYEKRADLSLDQLRQKYEEEVRDNGTSAFGKIKAAIATANRGAEVALQVLNDMAKAKYDEYFPTLAAKIPFPSIDAPEEKRRRYAADLGGFLKKLDDAYSKLEAAGKTLASSRVVEAVQLWQSVQQLKRLYEEQRRELGARKVFLETCKAKIEALGIRTSDATGLDRIVAMKQAFQNRKFGDAASGALVIADNAREVGSMLLTIGKLAKEVATNVA